MATMRVWFDVYNVSDEPSEALEQMNNLLDELGAVDTTLSWDDVNWDEVV
jgi:hypothetical protein